MTDQEIKFLAEKITEAEMMAKATAETEQKREKHHKVLTTAGYIAGSAALFAVACATLPTILSHVSGALYKSSLKKINRDDNDWGPVIERKEKSGGPEQIDEPAAREEDSKGGD